MKIMIDAGHGGKDPGAVAGHLREKDLTLKLALLIGEKLSDFGAEIHYTRKDDSAVELAARAKAANDGKADFFLSVHINAGGGTGFESFTFLNESRDGYSMIHNKVAQVFLKEGLPDRGLKQQNFAVLRETKMPAMLLEYGFIDHARDVLLLQKGAFLELLAQATAAGISEAFKLNKAPTAIPGSESYVSEWARAARQWVTETGISDGSRPQETVTREELWTMLHRMSKK